MTHSDVAPLYLDERVGWHVFAILFSLKNDRPSFLIAFRSYSILFSNYESHKAIRCTYTVYYEAARVFLCRAPRSKDENKFLVSRASTSEMGGEEKRRQVRPKT